MKGKFYSNLTDFPVHVLKQETNSYPITLEMTNLGPIALVLFNRKDSLELLDAVFGPASFSLSAFFYL